jgi:hypothetical protein
MLKFSKQVVLMSVLFFIGTALTPTNLQNGHSEIKNAFSKGDAELLKEVLSSSVEIELPSKVEGIYSRAQTILILNNFFKNNPPKDFSLNHSGQSASSSKFVVGKYESVNSNEYRVTLFMKKIGDKYFIQEIELEEE